MLFAVSLLFVVIQALQQLLNAQMVAFALNRQHTFARAGLGNFVRQHPDLHGECTGPHRKKCQVFPHTPRLTRADSSQQ